MANGLNLPRQLRVIADDLRRHGHTLEQLAGPNPERPGPRRVATAAALLEEAARLLIEVAGPAPVPAEQSPGRARGQALGAR